MKARPRPTPRVARWLAGGALAGLVVGAGLVACGNGDDTTSKLPAADGGADVTVDHAAAQDACTTDQANSTRCDPCADPATNPYNACSPFTSGCIPFDAARVPSHPTL